MCVYDAEDDADDDGGNIDYANGCCGVVQVADTPLGDGIGAVHVIANIEARVQRIRILLK